MNTDLEYGFEYLGSSPREVITPLTERVFVTMTQAVSAHTGVLCVGPQVSKLFTDFSALCLMKHLRMHLNLRPSLHLTQLTAIYTGIHMHTLMHIHTHMCSKIC